MSSTTVPNPANGSFPSRSSRLNAGCGIRLDISIAIVINTRPITSISPKISIWKPARDLERHHYMRHTDPPDKNDFLATIDICVKPVLLTNIQQMCGRTKRGTITYTNIYTHPNYRLPRKVASATAIKANQANLTTTSIIIMIMTSAILLLIIIITIWTVVMITWASRVR